MNLLSVASHPTVQSPNLSTHTRIVAIILAIFFVGFILELIRRHRLQERYSVIWLIAGFMMVVGAIFPSLLSVLARVMGVSDTNAALFSLILLMLLALSLHLTATISRHSEQITRLAQELAMERARQLPSNDPNYTAAEHAAPEAPAPLSRPAHPSDQPKTAGISPHESEQQVPQP